MVSHNVVSFLPSNQVICGNVTPFIICEGHDEVDEVNITNLTC